MMVAPRLGVCKLEPQSSFSPALCVATFSTDFKNFAGVSGSSFFPGVLQIVAARGVQISSKLVVENMKYKTTSSTTSDTQTKFHHVRGSFIPGRKCVSAHMKRQIVDLKIGNIQQRRFQGFFNVKFKSAYSTLTIGGLKKIIGNQTGLEVIALLYRGVCLEDNARKLRFLLPELQNIGPPDRFSAHTRIRPKVIPGGICINVMTVAWKTLQVYLPSDTCKVLELKKAIEGFEGIPVSRQSLMCEGKQLGNNDSSTLRESKLELGCTVHVLGRLCGGGGIPLPETLTLTPTRFADLETAPMKKVGWSKNFIVWRTTTPGLNIHGICTTPNCIALGKKVICPKGFTVFKLNEVVHCPACKERFNPTTCGFTDCRWMFEGRKEGSRLTCEVMSNWRTTGNLYEYFDDGQGQNTADWSRLIITAKLKLPQDWVLAKSESSVVSECSMCFEDLRSSSADTHSTSECGHKFHGQCARNWQEAGSTSCPVCQNSIV